MRNNKTEQRNMHQKSKATNAQKEFQGALVMDGMWCLPTTVGLNPFFDVLITKNTAPRVSVCKKDVQRIVRDFNARKDEQLSTAITSAIEELNVSTQNPSELFVVFSPDIPGGFEIVLANAGFEGHEDIATTFDFNAIAFDAKQFAKHLAEAHSAEHQIADRSWSMCYCLIGASQPGLDDAVEVWTARNPERAMIHAAAASPSKQFQFLGSLRTIEQAAISHSRLSRDPSSELLRDLRTGGSSCR